MKKATITCPYCKNTEEVEVPEHGCITMHDCKKCEKLISTSEEKGECCVVCSHSEAECAAPIK